MIEIGYVIEKGISENSGFLVVKLAEVQKRNFSFEFLPKNITLSYWKQLATPKDQDALKILGLKDVRLEESCLKIPYSQSIQALKLMAASGKLFFQQKQLICDFFTPVEFYYLVKDGQVNGMLKFLDQEFPLQSCDFICNGSQIWFIKGSLLKLIHTEVSWRDLKQLFFEPNTFSLQKLQEDDLQVHIVYTDNSLETFKQNAQPLPLLVLKDRSGAFADLWMDYGNGKQFTFHEVSVSKDKRDFNAEKNWEKDLLETGFIKKQVGNSHYYCPLDQVAKSLSFLLEIGWNIQDHQKKKVLLMNETRLEFSLQSNHVVVHGKLRFEDHETNLSDVAGAFNKRERFVQIGSESVGLLPEKWEKDNLASLFEEGEIVSDGLRFKKHQIGSLETFFKEPEKQQLDKAIYELKESLDSLSDIPPIYPSSSFKGSLRPYQQEGVNWLHFLHRFGFNGILSDDMGLGKTVQVLAFLSQMKLEKPILIVLPTSLLFNWKREIEHFLPSYTTLLHQGPQRGKSCEDLVGFSIILTSYAMMRIDLPLLQEMEFEAIILDEAQAIKNAHTQSAQAAFKLNSSFRLLLTGTPIENHLSEIWSHFHFLMPELLGEEKSFLADIQAGNSDVRYLQKIKKKIRPFVLRRKKTDVAKDLPDCVEQTIWIEMSSAQRQIYESYLAGIKSNLFTKIGVEGLSKHRLEIFEAILRLRQICCHPLLISSQLTQESIEFESGKFEALFQDLENIIEENGKVLVYSQFTSMLSLIGKEVRTRNWKHVYLDGNTKDREAVVNQFQEDPNTNLFLISLKAGGTGLNLTAADHVLIYDPWWNEAGEQQAINRAHRIGRKSTVFAKRYVTVESIEEKMMKLKEKKKLLIDSLFDDEAALGQLTLDDFAYLLNS